VSNRGMAACCGTTGMVLSVGDSLNGGIIAMGMVEVTTLHALGTGKSELSPSLMAE
jgi:hypothetical protein